MTTIGIVQPNYIPWRGYFDFIHEVDVFVFLDDVQYTRRDWRNRNRIKTPNGDTQWLSVPVLGGRDQLIRDVVIDEGQAWARKHLEALRHSYGKTPHFDRYFEELQDHYEPGRYRLLAELDVALVRLVASWLGIGTRFELASQHDAPGAKDDKLLALVRALDGGVYLSGPAARDYIRPQIWADANVELRYKDYAGYPDYAQISEPFEPAVSILDLLFMTGPEAPDYIWGAKRSAA